ncbi:hypothetical protein P154DRAFT_520359 [Amniculicola lignicola CBS 123094]|uniref:Uncharacterized protein n=1 Tax=Amniculicola lignicola CBS 123094 TaxID=1392246 RepID=A0A6A5WV90_9PLEO|nr:hypothetical protein P154DRAFT_520359 [Amniculicola lignicola CBS 123094]
MAGTNFVDDLVDNLLENFFNENDITAPLTTEPDSYFPQVGGKVQAIGSGKKASEALPPDVRKARLERINKEMIGMCDSEIKENEIATSKKTDTSKPTSFKGMGTYTHIAIKQAPAPNAFPHQRHVTERPEFLPLRGGSAPRGRYDIRPEHELPPNVRNAYAQLKTALEREQRSRNSELDPAARVGVLPVPETVRRPTTTVTTSTAVRLLEMMAIEGVGSASTSAAASRRQSTGGGDVAMGGAETAGTTYDAARDPRRRGR